MADGPRKDYPTDRLPQDDGDQFRIKLDNLGKGYRPGGSNDSQGTISDQTPIKYFRNDPYIGSSDWRRGLLFGQPQNVYNLTREIANDYDLPPIITPNRGITPLTNTPGTYPSRYDYDLFPVEPLTLRPKMTEPNIDSWNTQGTSEFIERFRKFVRPELEQKGGSIQNVPEEDTLHRDAGATQKYVRIGSSNPFLDDFSGLQTSTFYLAPKTDNTGEVISGESVTFSFRTPDQTKGSRREFFHDKSPKAPANRVVTRALNIPQGTTYERVTAEDGSETLKLTYPEDKPQFPENPKE